MSGGRVRVLLALVLVALLVALGAPRHHEVTITLVGDVMLGRGVADAIMEHGPHYPFEQVAAELSRGDLLFGNLEAPLTDRGIRIPRVNSLRGEPEMAPALAEVGFDAVSLANNHAIDYGREGLERTCEVLEAAGVAPVGVGATLAGARACRVIEARGVRVGFVAFSNFPEAVFIHDSQRTSICLLSDEALAAVIPAAARQCDVLVASVHWGQEGERWTSDFERATAHRMIDLGADIVVGHHAHVRGEVERYRGGIIAYGLGNLVFDADSYGGNEGWVLHVRATRDGVSEVEAVPVRVRECRAVIEQYH